jgi:hypothetical protein
MSDILGICLEKDYIQKICKHDQIVVRIKIHISKAIKGGMH